MKRIDPLMWFIVLIVVIAICSLGMVVAVAGDTEIQIVTNVPTWEYAALAYDGDTAFAFTPDLAANNEINKVYEAMTADELNAVIALNVMGERGWEYVDYQPGSTVVYMFKRPKG